MPRPQFVRDLLRLKHQGDWNKKHATALDAAVAYVLALQETTGLDIISDGEWRRLSYIGIVADMCDGFEVTYRGDQPWTIVTEPIRPHGTGMIAKEGQFIRTHSRCEPKVALPSPYLLGQRMWDPAKSSRAYPTREKFMWDLVPVFRKELDAIREAEITHVQIDDPHLCLFVDRRTRAQYERPGREMDLCVELLNAVIDGFGDLHTAIHLCRRNKGRAGWVAEGGYEPIMEHLRRLNVKTYMLEFAIPVAGDYTVLAGIPEDRCVGIGCVDCRSEHVDTPLEIVRRIEKALKFVPPERILIHPDCGFAPGSAAEIPIDEAYRKLCNQVRAAEVLRDKYGGR